MILLIRFILICTIIYLVIRSFARMADIEEDDKKKQMQKPKQNTGNLKNVKRIRKELGEYIDYEEIKDNKG